jgi:ABC-type Fe3+/spermidine/putrescine transport system ATPase subunit
MSDRIAVFNEGRVEQAGESGEGLVVEEGTIDDVSYAGMVTRFHVALDGGDRLQVARQNLEQTSHEDEGMRGQRVKVGWRREHTVAVAEQQG